MDGSVLVGFDCVKSNFFGINDFLKIVDFKIKIKTVIFYAYVDTHYDRLLCFAVSSLNFATRCFLVG